MDVDNYVWALYFAKTLMKNSKDSQVEYGDFCGVFLLICSLKNRFGVYVFDTGWLWVPQVTCRIRQLMWVLRLGPRPSVFSPTQPSLQPSSDGNKDQWPFYTCGTPWEVSVSMALRSCRISPGGRLSGDFSGCSPPSLVYWQRQRFSNLKSKPCCQLIQEIHLLHYIIRLF